MTSPCRKAAPVPVADGARALTTWHSCGQRDRRCGCRRGLRTPSCTTSLQVGPGRVGSPDHAGAGDAHVPLPRPLMLCHGPLLAGNEEKNPSCSPTAATAKKEGPDREREAIFSPSSLRPLPTRSWTPPTGPPQPLTWSLTSPPGSACRAGGHQRSAATLHQG